MLRILLTFLGIFLGAALLTGNIPPLWDALVAHDLRAATFVLGEALFVSANGAAGGMLGAAVGFLVGSTLAWLPHKDDCPRSCDGHHAAY